MSNVIRLAAKDIFMAIDEQPEREFLLKLTAVEIYNEKVRDLLTEGSEKQNLNLIEDSQRGVVVEGCADVGLQSASQLSELLVQIESKRTVSLCKFKPVFITKKFIKHCTCTVAHWMSLCEPPRLTPNAMS